MGCHCGKSSSIARHNGDSVHRLEPSSGSSGVFRRQGQTAGATAQGANTHLNNGFLGHGDMPGGLCTLLYMHTLDFIPRGGSVEPQPHPTAPVVLGRLYRRCILWAGKQQPQRCLLPAPTTLRAPILIISLEADNGFQEHCSLSVR